MKSLEKRLWLSFFLLVLNVTVAWILIILSGYIYDYCSSFFIFALAFIFNHSITSNRKYTENLCKAKNLDLKSFKKSDKSGLIIAFEGILFIILLHVDKTKVDIKTIIAIQVVFVALGILAEKFNLRNLSNTFDLD